MKPVIIAREDHCISRKNINPYALKVLYRLRAKGYTAYLAGGCVRDLLLGKTPNDFDVATDATPNQLKRTFSNCRLIGRRFRLAHIHFGREIIEVATFRSNETSDSPSDQSAIKGKSGVLVRDNIFGTPEQDAIRRDFTVNALYYDIEDYSIIDYAKALPDLEARVIRAIGDPDTRYIEDPVRMLRAVRFASTLDFTIEKEAYEALVRQVSQIAEASNARLYEEILKFMKSGAFGAAFKLLRESGLLSELTPVFSHWLENEAGEEGIEATWQACKQIDDWREAGTACSPALGYTMLFSAFHEYRVAQKSELGVPRPQAVTDVLIDHHQTLVQRILIPQRQLTEMIRILASQPAFLKQDEKKAKRLKGMACYADSFAYFQTQCHRTGNHVDRIPYWNGVEATQEQRKHRRRRPKRRPQN